MGQLGQLFHHALHLRLIPIFVKEMFNYVSRNRDESSAL